MRRYQVKIGHIYATKVNHRIAPVQILYGIERYGRPAHWVAQYLDTGKQIEIKSADKLRYEMVRDTDGHLHAART